MDSAAAWPDMSEAIPIFPLAGAMLLPYGRLPLNVFEPRYLALVDDALAAGRLFGMIQPDASKPETPSGPALFGVGCLGRITSFTETGDGRLLISLIGVVRFAVAEELAPKRGYRRVRGDFGAYAEDVGEEPLQFDYFIRFKELPVPGFIKCALIVGMVYLGQAAADLAGVQEI